MVSRLTSYNSTTSLIILRLCFIRAPSAQGQIDRHTSDGSVQGLWVLGKNDKEGPCDPGLLFVTSEVKCFLVVLAELNQRVWSVRVPLNIGGVRRPTGKIANLHNNAGVSIKCPFRPQGSSKRINCTRMPTSGLAARTPVDPDLREEEPSGCVSQ